MRFMSSKAHEIGWYKYYICMQIIRRENILDSELQVMNINIREGQETQECRECSNW